MADLLSKFEALEKTVLKHNADLAALQETNTAIKARLLAVQEAQKKTIDLIAATKRQMETMQSVVQNADYAVSHSRQAMQVVSTTIATLSAQQRAHHTTLGILTDSDRKQDTSIQATEQALQAMSTATRNRQELKALDRRVNFIAAAILGGVLIIGGHDMDIAQLEIWMTCAGIATEGYALLILTGNEYWVLDFIHTKFGGK
jgi:chromosome segregation ATPase